MPDYVHDVFISYKRDPYSDPWLIGEFIPAFSSMVRNSIAEVCGRRPASIFFDQSELSPHQLRFDQSGIEPGADWQHSLREALSTSRCLVTLWQPMYFYSEWCLTEWRSFHQRAQQTKSRVIVPLSVHDGLAFPQEAQALQAWNFSDYVLIGAGFRQTTLYIEFQQRLKQFARRVAEAVRDAPPFAEWPIVAPESLGGPVSPPPVPQLRL